MDRTRWIIFGVLVITVFGILIFNNRDSSVDVDKMDPQKVVTSTKKEEVIPDHLFGSESKKVVLFEYGDYQCPGCAAAHPKLKAVTEHYKEQLTFIFRNFPLTTIHPNALAAATAAEAAAMQNKFWQYHDKLYESQDDWSTADTDKRGAIFKKYAKELGLNEKQFEKDLANNAIARKIDTDQALGKKAGAQATPTLILAGKTLKTEQFNTQKDLEDTVREAIKASGQELPDPIAQ
jgi:protein-disulfide isomerase